MFKALMGGGRSSSDSRSSAKGSSSSRRRADSKASSTVSRKSSRGDDRDRGLGDLSAYPSSGSRSKRYADSAAGDSVASSYATADPGIFPPESDRTSRRRDLDDTDSRDRHRDGKSSRRRERIRSPSRERERTKPVRDDPSGDADGRDRASTTSRRERRRTQSGDTYTAPSGRFPADIMATPDHQFPGMTTTTGPGLEASPTVYDPHVQQQFPGQFPAYVAEPYRPPNPAGEAAEYYGDQGQSVADQPGVRPQQPLVIPNSQAHLQPASPVENPPPEPSTIGELGAAASYYNDVPGGQPPPQSSNLPSSKPPKPTVQAPGLAGPAVGAAAAYAAGHSSSDGHDPDSPQLSVGASPSNFVPAGKPPHKPSHSHGTGAAVGAAAAGAAAGYMLGHHHHSSSPDVSQYTMQNPDDVSLNGLGYPGPSMYPPHSNPPPYAAAGAAAAAGYAAHPSHPHHAAVYHGAPFPAGGLAFQPRQRGPLGKFIDFWRDPEGVGMYEDYTETIGVCKYCFEPGTTSRDAPRKHHYRPRRRSSDRYSSGSRVDKLSRYASSEDESRRRRKSRSSWLPGVLTGYAVKSLFNNKDFDDTYSVRTGQVVGSSYDSESVSTSRRSRTSRGVYRRSSRSRSRDRRSRHSHPDLHMTRYEDHRPRSRSRSRSSSGSKHTLRDAALGAAVGTAAMSLAKSRNRSRSRSRSPRKSKSRKSSSSDSSFVDISRPARRPVAGGFGSFFTASSENRKKRRAKKRRSIFSFNNSSSSSVDNDLAFGSAYARRSPGKLKKKGKKKDSGDVDAALLGLGAAATALAAKSHHRGRRRGEILAGKDSRSGPSDYASSATNDEGWEDLDSADQSSSSVSSALAFGDTGRFGDDSSHSSDSSASLWGWRWGSKKNKKKRTPKKDYLPAAAGVGAGVLGAAALAGRHRDSRTDSRDARTSSAGSLQQVAPIPTADPSRYETVNISSLPPEPAYVRPGAIPLQQPQPVTPVSQAVYTSQGESIHAYSAPAGPPIFDNSFGQYNYGQPSRETQWKPAYSEGPSNVVRPHRRSDSSPVPHTEPLEGVTATGLKRHSTLREQPSVQFDLTHEQEEKERRAARQQRSKRDSDRYDGVQLVDREGEMARRDAERESRRYDDRDGRRRRERDDDDEYNRGHKEKQSTSWIGDAAVGTMGAVAAAAILSKTSNDDSSETSQKRHDERRQKRRAERRRTTDESSVGSFPISDDTEERSYPKRDRSPSRRSTYPEPARPTPTYENYAEFFAPEGLRYSPDTYAQREPTSMPTIIEAVPASERSQVLTEELHPDYNALPWPVPSLKIIEPTPPQSLSGSVRGATSPIPATPEVIPEDKIAERQTTGSRVSWGEHELHEYEVPSTSSDHESVDHEAVRDHQRGLRDVSPIEEIPRSNESHSPKNTAKDFGTDVEFAATIAAATAATGFNPSIVTDNPMYHTRSSPPGAEKIDSWTEIVPGRDGQRGFVEGEVDTPQEKFIESEPLYDEPDFMTNRENKSQPEQPSIAQEVIAQLSQKKEDAAETAPEDYSMPGGFEPETSREGPKDDTRSVASAPMPGDFEDDSRRTHDFDVMGDAPAPAAEEGATEGKKKRRKRRSKRDSGDDLDDSVSIISSPARIGQGEEKEKRAEEKEKKSGGFLSSLFGSRVSEPVESNKSSDDRPASREVQSEIGPRTSDGPRRRRREGSSSRRSSGELAEDKENFNVESYKSSRQRREEKRRQRHEGILHSGEGAEDEKDREISQDQPFLEDSRELPIAVDDTMGTSPQPVQQTAAAGHYYDNDEEEGQRSRRSSVLHLTGSPTAVPLHFRRPPTSPGTPAASSPISPSTGSPTQSRHRRPNSTEFKHSREIRPLWLVERHGVTEAPEDEPLPSLPSSKTSSANASVEDLTTLPDETSWERVDLSHHVHDSRAPAPASPPHGEHDFLDSRQGTPTAAVFSHQQQPPLSRKDQLKYEFHSPSELLQDPSTYAELPPSPTLGALPSAEGSAVGVRDDLDLTDLPALPSSRPSTPENQMIHSEDVDETTPTQEKTTPTVKRSVSPSGCDIAGVAVAGAGLAAAVGAAVDKEEDTPHETGRDGPAATEDRDVPESPASAVFVDAPSGVTPDDGDEGVFATPVNQPDPEAARASETEIPEQAVPGERDLPEATVQEDPVEPSTSKKKKKKDKKKKNKAVEMPPDDTSAAPAPAIPSEEVPRLEGEQAVEEQLPALEPAMTVEEQPSVEPVSSLEAAEPGEPAKDVEEQQPDAETADVASVSSKKAKRDKKKKKKNKGGVAEDEPVLPADAAMEKPEEGQITEDTPKSTDGFVTPTEERARSPDVEGALAEDLPAVGMSTGQAETEATTREVHVDDGVQGEAVAMDEKSFDLSMTPVETGHVEPTPTMEQEKIEQPSTIPAEQQPEETGVDSTEPKALDDTPKEDEPASAATQDAEAEAPQMDVDSATKGVEAAPEQDPAAEVPAAEQTVPQTQDPELDASLSRKSSKKKKKKDKKKAAAEAEQIPSAEEEYAIKSEEGLEVRPEQTPEDNEVLAVPQSGQPEQGSEEKAIEDKEAHDIPQSEQPETLPEVPPETATVVEEPLPAEELSQKKKKKKNRKSSTSAVEPEAEPTPEAQPEPAEDAAVQPPHDGTSGELPAPASDSLDAQAPPEPVTNDDQQEPAAATDVEGTPATADEPSSQQPVETAEANDDTPHGPETAGEPDAGETASTGKKNKKKKKKSKGGGDSSTVDESMPSTESPIESAEVVPAESEPQAVLQGEPQAESAAEREVEFAPAAQEANMEPKPEPEQEPEQEEKPAESEPPTEMAEPPAETVPMTAAQKKKAKKEKKKQRQSALLQMSAEEVAEPTPAEADAALVAAADVEAEEPAAASEPPTEQPIVEAAPEPSEKEVAEAIDVPEQSVSKDVAEGPIDEAANEPIQREVVSGTEGQEDSVSKDMTEEPVGEEPAPAQREEKEQETTPVIGEETEVKDEPVTAELKEEPSEPAVDEPSKEERMDESNGQVSEPVQEEAHENVPEQKAEEPRTEADAAPTEEMQPTPKSKKDKKKKKKRQSLALEEQPAVETVAAAPEASVEPVEEPAPKEEAAPADSGEKPEEPAPETDSPELVKDPEVQAEGPSAESTSQDAPGTVELEEQPEAVEEPQPPMSKKQAKKEKKKKRKSVSFATEEPEIQPVEPGEPAVEASDITQETTEPAAEDAPVDKTKEGTNTSDVEASEMPEPVPAEKSEEASPVVAEHEEPKAPTDAEEEAPSSQDTAMEESTSINREAPEQVQSEVKESEDAPAGESKEESVAEPQQAEDVPAGDSKGESIAVPQQADLHPEAHTTQEDTVTASPETGDKVETEPSSEPAAAEPETPVDTEPEATAPKSKKDKKKKKKQKSVELTEEAAPTPDQQADEPQPVAEPAKEVETPTTETKLSGVESESPGESTLPQEEPQPETSEETPKEPVAANEPKEQAETREENLAIPEAEPAVAHEEPQQDAPEEQTQMETPQEDAMATMSAKERRKAKKKEKKRQSKNLDAETTEPTPIEDLPQAEMANDTTRDIPVEDAKPADEHPSLETAIAPAEDHGKDNQSHGTEMHADTDKDMIWTDEMVSSQVEQQQQSPPPTSSESPPPPAPEAEVGGATPEETKSADENIIESGVADEVVARGLPAEGSEELVDDAAREVLVHDEEVVVRGNQEGDMSAEQQDEHIQRKEEAEDVPSVDTAGSTSAAPEEVVAQTETAEEQPKAEKAMLPEVETPEPVTLSKKLSKKEKKKQRQVQKAQAFMQEPTEEAGQQEADIELEQPVQEKFEAPEQEVPETKEVQLPTSSEEAQVAIEGDGEGPESTVPGEAQSEDAAHVTEAKAHVGERQEDSTREEPSKEDGTEVQAEELWPVATKKKKAKKNKKASALHEDVELENIRDVEPAIESGNVEKETVSTMEVAPEPVTEEKELPKEDVDMTKETPENKPEETESMAEENQLLKGDVDMPVESPADKNEEPPKEVMEEPALSRKESKKKKKKAKKQAKEQGFLEAVPIVSTEPASAEPETKTLEDSGHHAGGLTEEVEKQPVESSEKAIEETEPTVSLDAPIEEKETAEPAGQNVQQEPLTSGDEARLEVEAPGKAGDFPESSSTNPEMEVPVARKLSKKEKRKAKQQAKLEASEPDVEKKLLEDQPHQEPEAIPIEESLTEDPLLSRKMSKKEKKKRKEKSADGSQVEVPVDTTGAREEETWPTIDWEKGQAEPVEKTPQSSPEAHHVTPFEPAIAEFDESAIPEGVAQQIDEPAANTTQDNNNPQAEGEQIIDVSVPESTKEAHVEVKEIPDETAPELNTKSVPEKRRTEEAEVLPHKQSKVANVFPHLERGLFKRPTSTESLRPVKDGAEDEARHEANRDFLASEAPIPTATDDRPSGYIPSPSSAQDYSQAQQSTAEHLESTMPRSPEASRSIGSETPYAPLHAPIPISESISALVSTVPADEPREASPDSCELRRSPSIHGRHNHPPRAWSLDEETPVPPAKTPPPLGPSTMEGSPPRTPLHTIAEDEPHERVETTKGSRTMEEAHGTPRLEMKPEHVLPRPQTPVRKFTDNALDRQRWPTPEPDDGGSGEAKVKKRGLHRGLFGSAEVLKTPEQDMPILRPSSVGSIASSGGGGGVRSLRRTNRSTSGDLRAASQMQEDEAAGGGVGSAQPPAPSPPQPTDLSIEHIPSSSSYDPLTDKGKRPLRSMTDVYEGWGETPSSPRSPSRPPSIRHRRSMQHLQELESRLDQLISENRLLLAARDAAEDKLRSASVARRKSDHALNTRDADLRDRVSEVEQLRNSVDWLQKEVSRLTEENEGLSTTNSNLTAAHVAELQALRESSSREVEVLRYENQQLSTDLHEKIRQQIDAALTQKNTELRRLREELESARDKVKELQQQIAASMHENVIVFRDEDYFDAACQKLCGHVQQWVLRFSKHSDHHRCRKLIDLQDEKIADRFDNAILDGSDADVYLADRVRRRDVFMSVVMTMVWEFIFTRYLFGMDREQRQKLKSLEKQLTEVGPRTAIHRWRATTLTLLAKRPTFARQRESDTEAVALEIFDTLSRILPPPSHVEAQLLESLRKVLRVAVSLSIEMRTQLAEYIMLPPLQPEYDTNGDLARQVYFNASLMNERSGETTSNEQLESQQAVVRVVLFPLVVKKGNDSGEGEDEVVVCPAQVLIARPGKDKKMDRILSSDRMSLDATKSVHSIAPSSTMDMSNVI